jgi:hypothetical protein
MRSLMRCVENVPTHQTAFVFFFRFAYSFLLKREDLQQGVLVNGVILTDLFKFVCIQRAFAGESIEMFACSVASGGTSTYISQYR